MSVKPRQVFNLNNFRGLDKDSKPLKVAPFRATDGKNFFIDSETLKTKPSYEMKFNPSFFLQAGDYIIDWHQFGETRVYVTRYHFYFETNGSSFNEQSTASNFLKGGIPTSFDFLDLRPHFQEEKEVLFIFCLGAIYVFSKVLSDGGVDKFVFYELNSKPANPYLPSNADLFKFFEDLPKPYEPLINVDGKPFDDVNLLSPVSKYQLFASSAQTHNNETTYVLPTHYNREKHGDFSTNENIAVTFYKNKYGTIPTVLPFFMGIEKSNFPSGSFTDYGTPFQTMVDGNSDGDNTDIPADVDVFAEIRDTYYPTGEFYYFGTSSSITGTVTEPYGLTREAFFKMVVKQTDGISVFEYMMDYIKNNQATFASMGTNKYVSFKMKVRYNASFRTTGTETTVERAVQEKYVYVFVLFKKYETDQFFLTSQTYAANSLTTTNTSSTTYPGYPSLTSTTHTFYINELSGDSAPSSIPADLSDVGVKDYFLINAQSLLTQKAPSVSDGQTVRINAKYYQETQVNVNSITVTLPSVISSNFNYNSVMGQTDKLNTSYPSYPSITSTDSVYQTITDIDGGLGNKFTFNSGTSEYNALYNAIYNNVIQNALTGIGTKVYQARVYKTYTLSDGTNVITFYSLASVKIEINYNIISTPTTAQKRYSLSVRGTAEKGTVPITDILYRIDFKEQDGEIRFTLKDWFFDFNNEPTIEIKVTFDENEDYKVIANSKFGITFGSENRLFLAGNPDFTNIDRFNVSNDLLGNGTKNQSYELTYFPSKNYRVIGGKGAINGYVIATDTELYITKEEYPNDNRLFIRQRTLNDQGIVGYNEFKTNIEKTPLNNRCIVRFYNDILVLAKDGLYGIEISSNVLTNERLVKLRSGFINNELKAKIASHNKNEIFIVENNRDMYMFIGKDIYVADSKYIAQNPGSQIENLSYEIVKWTSEVEWLSGKVYENDIYMLEKNGSVIYGFAFNNYDEYITKTESTLTVSDLPNYSGTKVFNMPSTYNYILTNSTTANNYAFVFTAGYKVVGVNPTDYTESAGTVSVVNDSMFAPFTDGNKLYWKEANTLVFNEFTVAGFESSGRDTFTYGSVAGERTRIYQSIANTKLYITAYWLYQGSYYFRLSPYRPTIVTQIVQGQTETDGAFITRIYGQLNRNEDYYFTTGGALNTLIEYVPYIITQWVSSITDFGNNLYEKTSFRINVFATKQENTNNMTFGYRTLRRLAGLTSPIDLSDNFNFQNVDYNQFALATFDTVGFSLPMKENNFLYIQFTINGVGKIELNGIEIIYKLNRAIKSVG
jgi:hypothetical protein